MTNLPMNCEWCAEPVLEHERTISHIVAHPECHFRLFGGSLAHVVRRCSCFVDGSPYTDPPRLSKRAAAALAHQLQNDFDEFFPDEPSEPHERKPPCVLR